MSNKIHWCMCMKLGAGSRGSTRHFRTTSIPESVLNQIPVTAEKPFKARSLNNLIKRQSSTLAHISLDPSILPPTTEPTSPFAKKSIQKPPMLFANANGEFNLESIISRENQGGFLQRHVGVELYSQEYFNMLDTIGVDSLSELVKATVPESIQMDSIQQHAFDNSVGTPLSERCVSQLMKDIGNDNKIFKTYIGQGWNPCETPSIISNNILRNPAWNTAYTPYQAEISQGRLEAQMNFQTMITELTGLPLANSSLLDEATACAEAMAVCFAAGKNKKQTFLIDSKCHPQNIEVMKTRAALKGYKTIIQQKTDFDFSDKDVAGCMLQYPDTEGRVFDYETLVKNAHNNKSLVAVACDPLALTILKTPGEFDADIAVGTTQRFGIPLWFGGPHAGFFATREQYKRLVPGRIVGKTMDSNGNECLRLALQTREQHIKRERATSNICTAQALLANASSFYAIYHGPEGLKQRARALHLVAKVLSLGIQSAGHSIEHGNIFDTIKVRVAGDRSEVLERAATKDINLRQFTDGVSLSISLNDLTTEQDISDLLQVFGCDQTIDQVYNNAKEINLDYEGPLARQNENFMSQNVFNSYHSEQEFARYCRKLELKDLSLVDGMIPLGSCTMKLNPSTTLDSMTLNTMSDVHPLVPVDQCSGWLNMLNDLERMLSESLGFDAFFLQPNSGAQGELAGLATIKAFHEYNGEGDTRKYIIIPTNAHGTNPASSALCGYQTKPIKVDADGNISMEDLDKQIKKFGKSIAGAMITYPSTYGTFQSSIREICDKIHAVGGQVYLDGANMNAQLGLAMPGDYGADVCHLNIHKSFAGPHGGGGPGAGPIGLKGHLIPHAPDNALRPNKVNASDSLGAIAGTDVGSPAVLTICWMYMKLLGSSGLAHSTKMAIFNANYMRARLQDHYDICFLGENGFNAHEFIIDFRPFKSTSGIEVADVAKRLQDFGLHSGTMSWPIANTLMLEPTESENKVDMDNYVDALIQIRKEIKMIENNEYSKENNPLKNAPHTLANVSSDQWDKPYSREAAAFPLQFVKDKKHWPTVGRVNDLYGDTNLVTTESDFCPCS